MLRNFFIGLLGLTLVLGAAACGEDDNNGGGDTFDRSAMLQHYAENIIQPAYEELADRTTVLVSQWEVFVNDPTGANLGLTREAWTDTYLAWQSANAFNFGPAGEAGTRKRLIEEIGTFPVDVDGIEAFIAAGDNSLNNFDRDTRGFLAVEYLLFGNGEPDDAIVSALQQPNRGAYLTAVLNHLQEQIDRVNDAWPAYADTFIANDGTDVGSATSQLYNEFVRSFESIKNFKVGLPAGKRPGQTQPEPALVEARFSNRSLSFLLAHAAAIEHLYFGIGADGTDGPGFYDYLLMVEGGPELAALTEAQWAQVELALGAVPTDVPFSTLIAEESPAVDDLHTELQKQTRFFKSDLSSLLGIAITFSSGDGD